MNNPENFHKKNILAVLFFLCVFFANAQQKRTLVWSDDFNKNGLPDTSKWGYDKGTGCPLNCGWGNNEQQYYTEGRTENARIINGCLIVEAKKENWEGSTFTSARLVSKNKGDWKYGSFEVRAKLPAGKGTWPAVWMLPTNNEYGNWPASGEIDIMEHVGYDPNNIHCSVHTEAFNHIKGTQKTAEKIVDQSMKDFHLYRVDWTASEITGFIDNEKYFEFKNNHLGYASWPFDKPFHLLINLAVGGNWGGKMGIDDAAFPTSMLIDYVRVYQWKD